MGAVDAGVIHQDVQLAEAGDDLVHCRVPGVLFSHVEPDEHALAARLVDLSLDPPPVFLQNVADNDLRPFAGEEPCLDRAHAPGAAADQCRLVL